MYVRYVLKGITRNNRKGGKGERRVIEGGIRSYWWVYEWLIATSQDQAMETRVEENGARYEKLFFSKLVFDTRQDKRLKCLAWSIERRRLKNKWTKTVQVWCTFMIMADHVRTINNRAEILYAIVLLHYQRSVPRQKWHWRSFRLTFAIFTKTSLYFRKRNQWNGPRNILSFNFSSDGIGSRFRHICEEEDRGGRFTRRRPVWFPLFWDPVEIFDPGRFFVFSSEAEYGITGGRKRKFMFGNSTQTIWQKALSPSLARPMLNFSESVVIFQSSSLLTVFLFLFRLFSFQFQKFWTWSW